MEILLGCGSSRVKKLSLPGREEWSGLVTLDFADTHKPDIVHDIAVLPLPFEDDCADECHAYEVMEHVGQQGDWRFFFDQWSDIWRILKPGGVFFGTSPHWSSAWAFGDPGHTRIVGAEQLTFLSQPNYTAQVGATPMTDYRFYYKADFDLIHSAVNAAGQYEYALRAVKPSRVENGR
jgi:SAM-dependent methyltransferase